MASKVVFTREPIYAALFAKVSGATWAAQSLTTATAFVTKSRKLRHWVDVQKEEMPALFQTQRTEPVTRESNRPPRWKMNVELFIYVATIAQQDADIIPSQQQNPIMDAIMQSLEPDAGSVVPGGGLDRCTLGGLVYDCKISGVVENFEGDLGDLGVLIVPVEITVPA